jgi:CspA family cold shock protein
MVERGVVKWFNEPKGLGFIIDKEGHDIFVHYSNIVGEGFKSLLEGDTVEFERVVGDKGFKADKVRVVTLR